MAFSLSVDCSCRPSVSQYDRDSSDGDAEGRDGDHASAVVVLGAWFFGEILEPGAEVAGVAGVVAVAEVFRNSVFRVADVAEDMMSRRAVFEAVGDSHQSTAEAVEAPVVAGVARWFNRLVGGPQAGKSADGRPSAGADFSGAASVLTRPRYEWMDGLVC